MDYFFKSEGCLSCSILLKIINERKENWTGLLEFVDVEFNVDKQLVTRIGDKTVEGSPVSKVPAFYSSEQDELYVGAEEAMEGMRNASWYNKP